MLKKVAEWSVEQIVMYLYREDRRSCNGLISLLSFSFQEVAGVDDSSLSISTRLVFYVYWNDSRVIRLKVKKFIDRPNIACPAWGF